MGKQVTKSTENSTEQNNDQDTSLNTSQNQQQNQMGNQAANAASGTQSQPADEATLRQRASTLFSVVQAAYTDVDTKGKKWSSTADRFGLCYKKAFDNHESVRLKQEAADQLAFDICFGVLSLCVGGALSSLATVAKSSNALKNATPWKVSGVTSIISGTIGKGVGGLKPAAKLPDVSIDPLSYYLDLKSNVSTHIANESESLNSYVQLVKDIQIGNQPLSLMENVDPQKVDSELQKAKRASHLFREPGQIDEAGLIRELEIGLWANWVKKLRYQVNTENQYRGTTSTYTARDSPGGIVEKHVTALTGEDFDFGWWTTGSEVDIIVDWGHSWTPSQTFSL